MDGNLTVFFTNMIGTLAVILVIAAFIGGSELMTKFFGSKSNWKYSLFAGLLGGVFGIYGTMSGLQLNGAVISVRDVGPMLAGFTGGPLGGLIAGVIAGAHRFFYVFLHNDKGYLITDPGTWDSATMLVTYACIIATICIGTMCGIFARKFNQKLKKPWWALLTGVLMEIFHLSLVFLIVRTPENPHAGLDIVKAIALPFILVNAVGFTLMITMINYIERQREITLERSRLKTELEVATVIQHSLLPPITETYPGRPEIGIAASMDPAKEVGGDFYDVFFVDKDRLAFVVADVSGKGIPAALFMATSKTTIQNCVRDYPTLSEAITVANDSLCSNNTAQMFVTAWIGVLDLSTGALTFVCAGHNPPVLISDGTPEFIKRRGGFVLAGMEGIPYREQTMTLKMGDRLFLYTDGVTEAENKAHELFGEQRLADCLKTDADKAPEEIIADVKAAINAHANGAEQFDDITMLCICYLGTK
ncbi:MAG: SpoIIE family protein phosphatase [Clostridia bacterium]|nr:SpoIIE family protein phosphatase [Clostridia bacterium]